MKPLIDGSKHQDILLVNNEERNVTMNQTEEECSVNITVNNDQEKEKTSQEQDLKQTSLETIMDDRIMTPMSSKTAMKERKTDLLRIKMKKSCPTDCNIKECSLRVDKKKTNNCKCHIVKTHCYFCYAHLYSDCADNADELEVGVRKCKKGYVS